MTTTRRATRSGAMALLAVAAMLLLSGCFTMKMDLALQPDDTVGGTLVLAVDDSLADLMGGKDAVAEALSGSTPFDTQPGEGSVEQRPYEADGLMGVEYVFDGIPIEDFSGTREAPESISITRDGDRFVVSGSMDLTSDELESQDLGAGAVLEGADVVVSITFPGEVYEADGVVDGNTVTWEPEIGQKTPMNAIGSANPGLNLGLLLGVALVGLLAVAGVVAFAVLRRRRDDAAPIGPLPEGSIVPGAPQRETVVVPVGQQVTEVVELPPPDGSDPAR